MTTSDQQPSPQPVQQPAQPQDLPQDQYAPADTARHQARKRLERKRKLVSDLVTYVVVNAFLIGVWAVTGRGYFWPAWILAGWGLGLVLAAWDVYGRKPITEQEVDAELRRRG